MIFKVFHTSYGWRKAFIVCRNEQGQLHQLFFDLGYKLKSGDGYVPPRDLKNGMSFEISEEEFEQAKTP